VPNVDERVRGSEVDCHVLTQEPEDPFTARVSTAWGYGKSATNLLGHRFALFVQDGFGGGNSRPDVEATLGFTPCVTCGFTVPRPAQ
jgi:hypothetical protein